MQDNVKNKRLCKSKLRNKVIEVARFFHFEHMLIEKWEEVLEILHM